jgi:integrase
MRQIFCVVFRRSVEILQMILYSAQGKAHIFTAAGLYDSFKKVAVSIGCPETRFHDLRHTYSVMSLEAGMDPKTLQYNLGHYSAAFTLDVYCHFIDEMKRKGAEKLDLFFDDLFDDTSI